MYSVLQEVELDNVTANLELKKTIESVKLMRKHAKARTAKGLLTV